MAAPPFNLDTSNPSDTAPEAPYPANERAFRNNITSYINTEHDILSGHHAFPELTTTQIAAITTWPTGALVYNTTLNTLQINIGTAAAPNFVSNAFGYTQTQLVTTSTSFVIPSIIVTAYLIGAGGGGGGGTANATYPSGGGGGGSGAVIIYPINGVTIGSTLSCTVGTGGSAGGAGANGGSGGDTVLASGTQTIPTADAGGGAGGQAGTASLTPANNGVGGTPTGGVLGQSINLPGLPGTIGFSIPSAIGIGGNGGIANSGLGAYGAGGPGGSAAVSTASGGSGGTAGCILFTWLTIEP